jgi:hypothetical protein
MATNTLEVASEEESLLITNAFIATSNALGDAIAALKRLEATTFDHATLDDLVLKRRRLEDEYAANERAFLAFCDKAMGLHPPTAKEVQAIVEIAGELALLTQKKATAAAILQLANKANAQFKVIRGS